MKRLEIVVNQSVEDDVIELLATVGHGESFTYMHPVFGRGGSGRREVSPVWPEANSLFLVFVESPVADATLAGLRALKDRFPSEGIRAWVSEADGVGV